MLLAREQTKAKRVSHVGDCPASPCLEGGLGYLVQQAVAWRMYQRWPILPSLPFLDKRQRELNLPAPRLPLPVYTIELFGV